MIARRMDIGYSIRVVRKFLTDFAKRVEVLKMIHVFPASGCLLGQHIHTIRIGGHGIGIPGTLAPLIQLWKPNE
jgi:hypothetical protein